MKSLKLTYTLLLLLIVTGLMAQSGPGVPTQVVAVGTEMTYTVDVDDDSNIENYFWTLKKSDGSIVIPTIVGDNPSQVISYENIPTGNYILSVYATNHPPYDCESDVIEINIEVIAQPLVRIVSGDKSGFCSFSSVSDNIEEFIFDVTIEGYFGSWTLKYTIYDPDGNAILISGGIQQSVHIIDSKTGRVVVPLGEEFVNNGTHEDYYTVIIDEAILDGEGSTPDIVPDNNIVKIGILPAINIGTISSQSTGE